MTKILSDWLKEDFEIKKGEVIPKKKYSYEVDGKVYNIDPSWIWVQIFCSKENPDLIVRCIPTLTHAACLILAEKHKDKVKLNTLKRTVHCFPHTNERLYGYMTVVNEDNVFADGEVCKETLNKTMFSYAATMMHKRAEDRLCLRALGLYQIGFYSETEFGGEDPEEHKNSITPDEIEERKHRERIIDIKKMVDILKEEDANFNPDVFSRTLIGKDKSEYTEDDWKVVYKALCNKMEGK